LANHDPQQLYATGFAHHLAGRLTEAERIYRAVLTDDPAHAGALHLRGVALHQFGQHPLALPLLWRAAALTPAEPNLWSNLGDALRADNAIEKADAALKRALILLPSHANAVHNLALTQLHLGQAKEARSLVNRAIALEPANPTFYYTLATELRLTDPDDPRLAVMEGLVRSLAGASPGDLSSLHFGLGASYKDLGQDDRSMRHFITGNRLKRQMLGYDEASTLGFLARLAEVYGPERFAALPPAERIGTGPIFVVGMPRSGTSLVEQILASHSRIFGAGELTLLEQTIVQHLPPGLSILSLPQLSLPELRRIGGAYWAALQARAPDAARIVDKLPLNFLHCGAIALMLPDARIVHVRRDPVDTCLSCFSTHFAGGHSYTLELADLGRFYRAYQRLMEHWRRVLPAGIMIELTYEEVVADLEGRMRPVLDLCGLTWEESCLDFHRTRRTVATASQTQVRQPLYKSRTSSWRPSNELLKPLLDALGE
jgi:tetratricopeptide (TPR) repeat protein